MAVMPQTLEPSLGDLVETANREHQLACEAGAVMMQAATAYLEHAVRAGEALTAIKSTMPGTWRRWLEANFAASYWTASFYMRCAAYHDEVREALGPAPSSTLIREFLQGRRTDRGGPRSPVTGLLSDAEGLENFVRLLDSGISQRQISIRTGLSRATVQRYADPEYRDRVLHGRSKQPQPQPEPEPEPEPEPGPSTPGPDPRATKYGEPGRAAVGRAVRTLAMREGREGTREALLDLAAIATAWADRLVA